MIEISSLLAADCKIAGIFRESLRYGIQKQGKFIFWPSVRD